MAASRSDLLAILERYARCPGIEVRQVERWRRRGWPFPRIAAEADRVAAALAATGVAAGDRVALHLTDGPLWHAAFFGTLRAGGVAVPLDPSYEPDLLHRVSAELGVTAWCTEREIAGPGADRPRVELRWEGEPVIGGVTGAPEVAGPPPWPPDDPDRLAEIVLTSGTSGAPQAVPVRHRNLRAVLDGLQPEIERYRWALRALPPISLAVALPLSHLYGQVMGVFLPPLLGARTALLPPLAAADLARALRDERAWVLATVPRTLALLGRYLVARGESRWGAAGMESRLADAAGKSWPLRWIAFDPLRRIVGRRLIAVVSGGAALDAETASLWRALGTVVLQGYGLTETAPLVTLTHPFRPQAGSLGRPLPGVEVRVAADGEILVRGPNVVAGRGVDPEGWLHTGDLGKQDAAGRLHYLGRKGERIVTPAGVNIDPDRIVQRLREEEAVRDAVVLERPWGERGIVCAVLLVPPGSDPSAAVQAANRELPDAARVRAWRAWPEADFPRTRTGKPMRAPIRAWLEAQAPAERLPAEDAEGAEDAEADAIAARGPGSPPTDPAAAVLRLAADIAGVPPEEIGPDMTIGDVLTSLDRVELVTRIEAAYGVTLGPEIFAGDSTLADAAAAVSRTGPRPSEPAATGAAERPEVITRSYAPAAPDIPPAWWRFHPAVRATRFAFREGFLRPFWGTFFDMDVGGAGVFDDLSPPFLVAANHLSELDPGTVLFALPARTSRRIATTAMWEYFPRARTGPALYALAVWGLDLIPLVQIGDWRPTLWVAGRVVDRGGCPLVYPEGERSLDGALLPFRGGIAVMARELHLPIVPCGAAGLLAVLPTGSHWVRRCWIGRAPVAVRFGDPIPAPGPGDDLDRVLAEIEKRIQALVVEARSAAGRY